MLTCVQAGIAPASIVIVNTASMMAMCVIVFLIFTDMACSFLFSPTGFDIYILAEDVSQKTDTKKPCALAAKVNEKLSAIFFLCYY